DVDPLLGGEIENSMVEAGGQFVGVDWSRQIKPAEKPSLTEFAKMHLSLILGVLVFYFGANNDRCWHCDDMHIFCVEAWNSHAEAKLPALFDQLSFRALDDFPLRL